MTALPTQVGRAASTAVAVNGHAPTPLHDAATNVYRMSCDRCGWHGRAVPPWRRSPTGLGPDIRRRLDNSWVIHAGQIALGVVIVHGQPDTGCHCPPCEAATLAALRARLGWRA